MTSQTTTSQTLRIGDLDIQVEILPLTTARDEQVRDLGARAEPLPLERWPMAPAELAGMATAKLTSCGGRPDRIDDCRWALSTIGAGLGYVIRPATTRMERNARQADARIAVLRGDV